MKTAHRNAILLAGLAAGAEATSILCRSLPGDVTWPSAIVWAGLNKTVDGRLVAEVPLGHVCHDPTYDAAACAALQEKWTLPTTQSVPAPLHAMLF